MASAKILLLLATVGIAVSLTNAEVQLITKPQPGQEYVFLQTSAAGSRPVERKEKPSENERVFETAHKLPPSLTFALNQAEAEEGEIQKEAKSPKAANKAGKPKREALPADAPVAAPAGAIKLDVQALLAKYKTDLKTSTTTTTGKPNTTKGGTRSTRKPRLNPIIGNKRSKKEAHDESFIATTASSVLTTSAAGLRPVERDDDVPLVASGSEKQRSRIQIKKGPNGQEYEYEYVYYYYDDDESDKKDKKSSAHDGPARNEITPQSASSRSGSRSEAKAVTVEPASNEVVPTSRGRTRGRQLEDEDVADERLPANTRFPPRSRNLNTTPSSGEEVVEEVKPRGRGRGRPEAQPAATSAESNSDNVSDETQGSRGRTRANVRRPSLELVDSASFNTHTSSGEPPNGSGPTFPADLPAGPVRFLGATPNERMDLTEKKEPSAETDAPAAPAGNEEVTTMMNAMDKVALDLYAILQGTQRLSGDESEGNTELITEAEVETTTLEITTEIPTTEAPTTTTTTTTTTTPAPSTAAPENVFGRGKYRTRPAIGGRKSVTTTTTTEAPAPAEGKPKSRFGRPSFGSRPRARPVATPTEGDTEQKETKEEAKPVSAPRTRSRFGAGRTRVTTAAPEGTTEAKAAAPTKSSLRPRPTFNLRGRTRPTPAPEGESAPTEEAHEASSTTVRSRPKLNASNVRPLRPGPRINLAGGRGRLGVTTAAPVETPAEPAPVAEEDQEKTNAEETEPKEAEPTPAPDTNPLSRLRNRQRTPLQVRPAAPKVAASAPVQVRRANPLISRRKPIGEASTTEAAPAAEAHAAEAETAADEEGATDAAPSSTTSTTEEPKGLNKLLAGRRRLNLRQPGTVA